jgi:hypothetical protein
MTTRTTPLCGTMTSTPSSTTSYGSSGAATIVKEGCWRKRSQRLDAETAGRTRDWRGLQAETVCGDWRRRHGHLPLMTTVPSATRRTTPSVHSATSCLATTCVLSSSNITAGGAL